jgi:hypothetical protein
MGYRGEDASRTPANWGQQPPRQSSPGSGEGNADAWIDGPQQGYGNDDYDDYASGGVGYGYENGGNYGGYPQQDPAGGPQAQYGQGDPYGSQAPYGGPGGYDEPAGYNDPAGYDQPAGYSGPADYGYQQPGLPVGGYGQQPGYDQQSYGQQNYGQPAEPGYGTPGGGPQGYQEADDGSGPGGGYPPRHGGGSGAYPGQDAGNDWYGGQPAAASGASFADTGTYALNGRIIDEYGTGPREAMHNPVRGYPPSPGQPQGAGPMQGRAQLPAPARPVVSGPQGVPNTGAQERYDDYDSYPGYGGEPAADYPTAFRGATGDFPTTVGSPSGAYPVADLGPGGDYPTTVRNPSGGYPAAGRALSGDFPTTVGSPSGAYPVADRNPSGDYPTTVGGGYGGYGDGYGQDAPYRDTGGRGYDAYNDPAVGYAPAPGGDQRGYDDYAAAGGLYQDPYAEGTEQPGVGKTGKNGRTKAKKGATKDRPGQPAGQGRRRGRRPLGLAALAVAVVLVAGAAAYVFLLKPDSNTSNNASTATSPLPTASAQPSAQACVKVYGTYCHIETRTDDPTPLTVAELFPPVVNDETNGHITSSFTLATTKVDKNCANAVIGSNLITELKDGDCTQVLRASYVSGDGKMMGTIGVINLETTTKAHYAGKVVDQNDFIAPLAASKGVAKKLGQGTGVVEAEFKGHYLILTWSEFVSGSTPSTTAEDNELEQFSSDLVAGTVNLSLSQRMVTGDAPSPGATA